MKKIHFVIYLQGKQGTRYVFRWDCPK